MRLLNRNSEATPTPYVVPPTNKFEGNDGSWSTFYINVGFGSGQNFRVLISTASSLTWVIDQSGCTGSDPANCPDLRGVEPYGGAKSPGYNSNLSPNATQIGLYGLKLDGGTSGTDFSTIYGSRYTGINASVYEDVIGLGQSSPTSLQLNEILASVASKDIFLGEFGLGILPNNFGSGDYASFMSYLPTCSMPIPSLSYGYTAGASYRPGNFYGNLVLGGYDASRFTFPAHSYNIMTLPNDTLTTFVQSIVVVSGSNTQSATVDDQDFSRAFTAQIDSTFPYLWLPDAVVDRFVEIFGLTYDQVTDLYTINATQRTQNVNNAPTISIKMAETASSSNITEIKLPYSAFDLTASWPIFNSTTAYFPIRRSPTGVFVLGRTLLQESYLIVDYGRQNWSLGQANFPGSMPSPNVVPILNTTTSTSHTGKGSSSLGAGAFAGIIVAAVVVAVAIIAAILFFMRRYKKRRSSIATTPFTMSDVTPMDPSKLFQGGVSPTGPLGLGQRRSVRSNESDVYSELPSSVGGGPLSPANVHPPEGFYAVVGTRDRRVSELPSPERDVKEWLEGKSNHSRGPSDSSTELSGGDIPVAELPAESITPEFLSDGTPSPGPGVLDDPVAAAGRNGDNATRTTARRPLTVVHEVEVDGEEENEGERAPELPLAAVQDSVEENTTSPASQEQ